MMVRAENIQVYLMIVGYSGCSNTFPTSIIVLSQLAWLLESQQKPDFGVLEFL